MTYQEARTILLKFLGYPQEFKVMSLNTLNIKILNELSLINLSKMRLRFQTKNKQTILVRKEKELLELLEQVIMAIDIIKLLIDCPNRTYVTKIVNMNEDYFSFFLPVDETLQFVINEINLGDK